MKLTAGDKAPNFRLPSTNGDNVALSDFKGQRLVLYFYPKDNTPGCTREACDFRDNFSRVAATGTTVLGVSKDSVDSHHTFRADMKLPFHLLADVDNTVATAYGAYGKKTMYGKSVTGTIRSTFIIGPEGKIERAWSSVKVDGHVDAVLAALVPPTAAKKKAQKPRNQKQTKRSR